MPKLLTVIMKSLLKVILFFHCIHEMLYTLTPCYTSIDVQIKKAFFAAVLQMRSKNPTNTENDLCGAAPA
jgi:hypothetical protein